ncbi:Hypothetical protein ADU72_1673 [Pediococcus damnosus]|uniref:Uncharacterized protein n=1 Tax=Pediococcus damnosus TaxID=51663 RepID=A0AAC9B184_9LACO|nr:Hypothetical protein ADU70_1030 [Pediococcus damnosus]AMV64229.1 Hypothetical protein ADU71_0306 [Pediococcus damnosus]AMV67598.1 Hypothetical protein ADU72_1673 [Pediococcus damnosus]
MIITEKPQLLKKMRNTNKGTASAEDDFDTLRDSFFYR